MDVTWNTLPPHPIHTPHPIPPTTYTHTSTNGEHHLLFNIVLSLIIAVQTQGRGRVYHNISTRWELFFSTPLHAHLELSKYPKSPVHFGTEITWKLTLGNSSGFLGSL